MIVLGIDPGATMGWAVLRRTKRASKLVASGVLKYKSPTLERWRKLHDDVRVLLMKYSPTDIVVERPMNLKSWGAIRSVTGTIVIVERIAASYRGAFGYVHANDIKEVATKKRSATKEEMQRAAKKRWRLRELPKPDEADAMWIAQTWTGT